MITKSELKHLTYKINGAAIEVQKGIGCGLLESIYHKCMIHELQQREIEFETEINIPVIYKGLEMRTNLRCDFFIENTIVVEIKACEKILPIHMAQIMTYMKLLKAPKGIIYNFNSENIYNSGYKSIVNEYFNQLE